MWSLDDIKNLPNDPKLEHLVAAGLLPQPAPPQSIIPNANVAPMTPVTPASKAADWIHGVGKFEGPPTGSPGAFRIGTGIGTSTPPESTTPAKTGGWKEKLSAPLSGPTNSPPAPASAADPTMGIGPLTNLSPAPPGGITTLSGELPALPHLNFKQRQALPTTSEGVPSNSPGESLAELQRMQDQDKNPYGSAENHPGILGKIGHYAARIGNIAGNIVAPATMANIPGTELNRADKERELKGELRGRERFEEEKKTGESERELRSAQAQKAREYPPEKIQNEAFEDLMSGGDNGTPRINEETQKPFTKLEAYERVMQASARPAGHQNLEQGLAGAVQKAVNAGHDLKDDREVQAWAQAIKDYKPSKDTDVKTVEDLKHRIVLAMESGDAAGAAQLQKELTATDPEGMSRLANTQLQMAALAADRADKREDREERQGLKWVSGEMPGTHETVTVPLSQAKAMGLENQAEAGQDHVGKVLAARVVVPMLYDTDPADPGVIQLINQLDKNGELGVVASRWNDFMARKVGADPTKDQLFTRLRNRLDLAQTKMMQAHVGNRGGAFMLDHFLALAEVGKLDANTLRAGVDEELRYMHRMSEKPPSSAARGSAAKPAGGGHSFTVNGKSYENVPDDVYQRAKKKPGFKE